MFPEHIPGGATVWARKTTDSIIFYDKPDKWFKIWFFLVNRVNHKDHRRWKRGQCFLTYQEIMIATKATKAQVDMCFRFLKSSQMVTTQKTTRGMTITVLKYEVYQDLNNYKNDTENDLKTTEKRQRNDTINKNDKNDKKLGEAEAPHKLPFKRKKDMGWKNYQGDEPDIPDIDLDSGEVIKPKEKPKRRYKEVFDLFAVLGPVPLNWRVNTTEQKCAENLYTERGIEKIKNALQFYKEHKDEEYCPEIRSPYDLDSKWKKLLNHKKRNNG